jgi:hypothetical protein
VVGAFVKTSRRNRAATRPQWSKLGDFLVTDWLESGVKLKKWRDMLKTPGHMAILQDEELYHVAGDEYG